MSDSDSSGSLNEWALVENQESSKESDGSNEFVCVDDCRSVSYHHKTSSVDGAVTSEEGHLSIPALLQENDVLSESSPVAESSTVTDSVTMTTAVACDEAGSTTSSSSLEELNIPTEDDLNQSSSSLEVLSLTREDGDGELDGQAVAGPSTLEEASAANLKACKESLNGSRDWHPEEPMRNPMRMRQQSGSDTDNSDFVRLDTNQVDDGGVDMMNLSSASSSVSSTFRFIHRSDMVLGEEPARRVYYRDNDEDSVQSDIDDRCESDISGVAGDDSDLSNLTYSLGDVPIAVGNVARSYKHKPNNSLNAILTTIALVALFFALGIGLGDFIGFHRQAGLRLQQVTKLRSLQDDYLLCLKEQEENAEFLEEQQKENEVLQAVTEEWKQQYEELILERVALESKIEQLQVRMNLDVQTGRTILEEIDGSGLAQLSSDDEKLNVKLAEVDVITENTADQVATIPDDQNEINVNKMAVEEIVTKLQTEVDVLTDEKKGLEFRMALMKDDILLEKEHLQSMKEELEQKLSENVTAQLQKEVASLQKEKDDLLFKIDLMRYDVISERQMLQDLQIAAEGKLERFQELLTENSDLKQAVARLRYTEHPGNAVLTLSTDSQEGTDHLKHEISRLEKEVANLQEKLQAMSESLKRENQLATMWQERFVKKSYELDEVLKKSPELAQCLSLIIPAISLTDVAGIPGDALRNLSDIVTSQMDVIYKLAEDSQFLSEVNAKWETLKTMIDSPFAEEMSDQTREAYEDIRNFVVQRLESLGVVFSKSCAVNNDTPKYSGESEEEMNSYSSHLHRMVNQTKESVTKLTKKINQTWEKVKDVSGHVTHKVMKDVLPVVKDKVEKLGGKMKHGWDTMKRKVKTGLFQDNKNRERKKQSKKEKEEKKNKRRGGRKDRMSPEDRRQYHGDPYKNDGQRLFDDTFTQTNHQFEHKPEHKQKTSDTHMDKNSQSKFWEGVGGFNPDVLLPDGFFEGNERKWRKHQKVLKKLHGRINKLNEDILHDMDDDDIEDLYDDLEDFQEDLEDEVQPKGLQTWLTCQVRWWKGRFQRKHRNEDLVMGCGRQLMHWQVKASCEVKGQQGEVAMPACLQYFPDRSVIRTVANDDSSSAKDKSNHHLKKTNPKGYEKKDKYMKGGENMCKKNRGEEQSFSVTGKENGNQEFSSFEKESDYILTDEKLFQNLTYDDDRSAAWWFEREQNRENHHVSGKWYWQRRHLSYADYLPSTSGSEGGHSDASWYFTRADWREFYHHDPRWMFGRAKSRAFQRDKPWYVERAEKRGDAHKKYKDN